MLFHIFGHINSANGIFIIKQKRSQCLAKLGLADTRRAKKQERTNRTRRILQAGTRTANGSRDGGNRLLLSDDAVMQSILHRQQFFSFARH